MIYLAPATVLESLVSRTAGQTESDVDVPVARVVADVAVGNGRVAGDAEPATATDAAGGGAVQIEAPLPHVSTHVMESELIRLLLRYRVWLPFSIILKPPYGTQIIAPRISIFL